MAETIGTPFTSENAREMQARSAAKRRENAQKFRDEMQAKLLEAQGGVIAGKLLAQDDWRAWVAAVEQAFGKPTDKIEHEHTGDVTFVLRSAFDDDDRGSGSSVQSEPSAEPAGEGVEDPGSHPASS